MRSALLSIVAIASVWAFVPRALRAQSPASSVPAAPRATKATIEMKRLAYEPATLTVATDTTVYFHNADIVAHTITANDRSFDSRNVDAGASWTHVFTKAGTYDYLCADHPSMHGTVVVK